MLTCKQIASVASDYLDNNSPDNNGLNNNGLNNNASLKWQIRLHLLMCANCRRFVRHLKITQEVSAGMVKKSSTEDAEIIWNKLQAHIKKGK